MLAEPETIWAVIATASGVAVAVTPVVVGVVSVSSSSVVSVGSSGAGVGMIGVTGVPQIATSLASLIAVRKAASRPEASQTPSSATATSRAILIGSERRKRA